MKIGPFELRRARGADQAPPQTPHKPVGASGTINFKGFLQPDEYNDDLRWPRGLTLYQRMVRSDGAVREAYMHTVAPVLNATWDIDAASDEPQDLEIAEFVRRAYFEWCESPFEQTMALTLKYLAQGFQLFELTDQIVDADLVYTDPATDAEVTVPRRQFLTWKRWEHRRPETIYKWNTVGGVLQEVVQLAFKDETYGEWTIPADCVALFTNEQEGDDFTGVSLLRAAYKSWVMKDLVEKVMAMSVERHGLGINTAYVPDDARNDDTLVAKVEDMLQGIRAGDSNYLVFPGPKQAGAAGSTGTGTSGYLFEINTPPGGLPDFVPALNYLRGDIKGAVLARFSELGHGSVGARATSNTQAEIWYAALHATASYVASVHGAQIKRLVLRNYPGVERFPSLVPRDIETKSLQEFATANAALVAAGAVVTDKTYRAYVRQGIDAPDEDETTEETGTTTDLGTEPEGGGALTPEEIQRRAAQQPPVKPVDSATDAALARLSGDVDRLAGIVIEQRDRGQLEELAVLLDRQAEQMRDALAELPTPQVIVRPSFTVHRDGKRTRRVLTFDEQGEVTGSIEEPLDDE